MIHSSSVPQSFEKGTYKRVNGLRAGRKARTKDWNWGKLRRREAIFDHQSLDQISPFVCDPVPLVLSILGGHQGTLDRAGYGTTHQLSDRGG